MSCEEGSSLTVQSERDDADINVIVRRFGLTGQLPQNVGAPLNVEFLEVFDFQSAMNVIRQAEESFMAMPAEVRARFQNDAARFVDFCSDEKNRAEAIKLGLAFAKEIVDNTASTTVTEKGNGTNGAGGRAAALPGTGSGSAEGS